MVPRLGLCAPRWRKGEGETWPRCDQDNCRVCPDQVKDTRCSHAHHASATTRIFVKAGREMPRCARRWKPSEPLLVLQNNTSDLPLDGPGRRSSLVSAPPPRLCCSRSPPPPQRLARACWVDVSWQSRHACNISYRWYVCPWRRGGGGGKKKMIALLSQSLLSSVSCCKLEIWVVLLDRGGTPLLSRNKVQES